jgi:hypothetical protein
MQAIELLAADNELYHRLQVGARERSRGFSTSIWTDRFVGFCEPQKQISDS